MPAQDYILRMIEQLARVLRRIMFLTEGAKYEEAREEIAGASRQLIGMELGFLMQLPDEDIIGLLAPPDANDPSKCLAAAELIRLRGAVQEADFGIDASYPFYLKALNLFLRTAGITDLSRGGYAASVTAIEDKLSAFVLPLGTCSSLLAYHESAGSYARLEDALFRSLHHLSPDEAIVLARQIEAIFSRLLGIGDGEIQAGGLRREEVEEALKEIRALVQFQERDDDSSKDSSPEGAAGL